VGYRGLLVHSTVQGSNNKHPNTVKNTRKDRQMRRQDHTCKAVQTKVICQDKSSCNQANWSDLGELYLLIAYLLL